MKDITSRSTSMTMKANLFLKNILLLFTFLFSFSSLAKVEHYDFYSKERLLELKKADKKMVLVATGWSESGLANIRKRHNEQKQKRGFAPSYLLATRLFLEGIKGKIYYLTTSPIEVSYRRHLFFIATGSDSFKAFEDFEKEYITIIKFEGPKIGEQGLSYLQKPENKANLNFLLSEINQLKEKSDTHIVGMTMHTSSALLKKWSRFLGIPFVANHPKLDHWRRKSMSRENYRALGLPHPRGTYTPVKTVQELAEDILAILKETDSSKVIIKLDYSAAGDGNKIIDFKEELASDYFLASEELAIESIKEKLDFTGGYLRRFLNFGAIVEEFIVADEFYSPASLFTVNSKRNVQIYHQYNQVLGGNHAQVFQGSQGPLPKDDQTTSIIIDYTQRVGRYLGKQKVRGNVGTDFIVFKKDGSPKKQVYLIENNVRHTGTMYAYLSAAFILGWDNLEGKYINTFDQLKVPTYKKASDRRKYQNRFFVWLRQRPYAYDPIKQEGLFIHQPTFGLSSIGATIVSKDAKSSFQIMEQLRIDLEQFNQTNR